MNKKKSIMAKLSFGLTLLEVVYYALISIQNMILTPYQNHPSIEYKSVISTILLILNIFGIAFAVVSFVRKEEKKQYAYMGLFLNSLSIITLGIISIIIK